MIKNKVEKGETGNHCITQTQSQSFTIKFLMKTNLELLPYSFRNHHITLCKVSREIFKTDKNMLAKVQARRFKSQQMWKCVSGSRAKPEIQDLPGVLKVEADW